MVTAIPLGEQYILDLIEHHGSHVHATRVAIMDDPSYLVDKGVSWHLSENDDHTHIKLWTVQNDNILAEITVNRTNTSFWVAYKTLRDATLDVLNAGECS